jgi:hypothetical protein
VKLQERTMNKQDERGWVVVGALFATLFLIWGPVNAGGVFFIPVTKHFGWSRADFSRYWSVRLRWRLASAVRRSDG